MLKYKLLMKTFITRLVFYTVQFTWGAVQNILGLLMSLFYINCRKEYYHGAHIFYHNGLWGGMSLGAFIFINGNRDKVWTENAKIHEYGHTVQSLILGPLYLFVIGIPSMVWCNSKKYRNLRREKGISYYAFYPEKWANRLGAGATRERMTEI